MSFLTFCPTVFLVMSTLIAIFALITFLSLICACLNPEVLYEEIL